MKLIPGMKGCQIWGEDQYKPEFTLAALSGRRRSRSSVQTRLPPCPAQLFEVSAVFLSHSARSRRHATLPSCFPITDGSCHRASYP